MKIAFACFAAVALLLNGCCHTAAVDPSAGWEPLFDGESLAGWRAYGSTNAPAPGWAVTDGLLHKRAGVRGGDIITERRFTDFEFAWEWRVVPGGNNGVKYLVTEARRGAPGHEYQMIDDAGHSDARRGPKWQTASFYDVFPPAADKPTLPGGEWNSSRIVVLGNHVEHWLNGARVLAYELGAPETKAAIAQSKFRNAAGFGDKVTGPIMLTDHQDETWFRNLRVRELK